MRWVSLSFLQLNINAIKAIINSIGFIFTFIIEWINRCYLQLYKDTDFEAMVAYRIKVFPVVFELSKKFIRLK